MELGAKAPGLTKIDVGWCRGVDDFVIKGLLEGCERLKEIKCYGCNRVTENCPRKVSLYSCRCCLVLIYDFDPQSNVKIFGVESHKMA